MKSASEINTVFAPDWRSGNSYQQDLSRGLQSLGVRVHFLRRYRRVLPLLRGLQDFPKQSILHLHWPEGYLGNPKHWLYGARLIRLPWDVSLAIRQRPFVMTAHNVYPHHLPQSNRLHRTLRRVYQAADAVIAHTAKAKERLHYEFRIPEKRIHVIKHGEDPEVTAPLPNRQQALNELQREGNQPLCLMFGAVSEYKGLEEIIEYWNRTKLEIDLAIVGRPHTVEYGENLRKLAAKNDRIMLRLEFVKREELRAWLAIADCCLFNYRQILTSGSIHPPRALGIPVLIPTRLTSLDLGEPNLRVFRFRNVDELPELLNKAVRIGSDYEAADEWRKEHDWNQIAEQTRDLYRRVSS